MNCPFCGSTHLEESSNFNEYSCNFCKCEFKNDGERVRIFEDGNYKKFCENVMYNLCEKASPKVSRILVSVISQLKNNGVEEIDAILEHLQLVSANVSSEMVIGLQSAEELEVVKEGIERFTTLGNTLLKRDDLEIDLSRFTRLQESQAFYEKVYVSRIDSPTIKTPNGSVVAGAVDENAFKDQIDPNGEIPEAPEASAFDGLTPRPGGGVVGGVSDNLPGAMDDIGDVDDVPPVAAQLPIAQPPVDIGSDPADALGKPPLGVPADLSPEDMAAGNEPYDMDGLADLLAKQYQSGQISQDADFMEALMNCQEANAMCENLGAMEETKIYELAQLVQQKLSADPDGGVTLTPDASDIAPDVSSDVPITTEQLQEAIEILASKLTESELKDL